MAIGIETDNSEKSALIKGLEALAAGVERLKPPTWQPIASAPKDGRAFLAYADGKITTVHWIKESPDREAFWSLCVPGTFTLHNFWEPTHWMPLPAGPEGV